MCLQLSALFGCLWAAGALSQECLRAITQRPGRLGRVWDQRLAHVSAGLFAGARVFARLSGVAPVLVPALRAIRLNACAGSCALVRMAVLPDSASACVRAHPFLRRRAAGILAGTIARKAAVPGWYLVLRMRWVLLACEQPYLPELACARARLVALVPPSLGSRALHPNNCACGGCLRKPLHWGPVLQPSRLRALRFCGRER